MDDAAASPLYAHNRRLTVEGQAMNPIEDQWIDEAAAELKGFHSHRLVDRFMERYGLQSKKLKTVKAKIGEIKRCILATDHPLRLDDLADYLDELKPYGRQLIFLWRLKKGNDAAVYLASLANPRYVEELLGEDHQDRLNGGRLVWRADAPTLAEVRHPGAGRRGVLSFKWVATRHYFIPAKPAAPNTPPVPRPRTQRAVTFFQVNLDNGDCELRIHGLSQKGDGLPEPREELERYRAEVAKLIELSHFSPVLIEPVAHRWLREPLPGLTITRWQVVRPSGEFLGGGGGGAGFFSKLLLKVGHYFAREMTLKWGRNQEVVNKPLFFSLDGRADAVEFNGMADASRVDFLLGQIRQGRHAPLRMRELRQLTANHPEHARIFATLDHLFATRKEPRASAVEVAKDAWYDPATIRQVFDLAAKEFPKVFTLEGDVLVLSNRIDVRGGGLAAVLERKAKEMGYPAAQTLVKPAMAAFTPLAFYFYYRLGSWLWLKFLERWTGVSFDDVGLGLVGLVLGLHLLATFGGATLRELALRVWRLIRPAIRWLNSLTPGELPVNELDALYQRSLSISIRASRRRSAAASPAPLDPPQPDLPALPQAS
jgi:hypothetical protein